MSLGALLPYLPLLSFDRVYVTDDGFTSDIFNGELPGRVLVGRLIASGQAPVWSSSLCSGVPLGGGEPIGLALFSTLGVASALCAYVVICVLVAAHGTYAFARRLGSDRVGACLAGLAYAGSGYFVTQLKHLGILSTVVGLPWALLFLDRALASRTAPESDANCRREAVKDLFRRLRDIGAFGLVFAEQVLCGFPQTAYYSALVYAAWALWWLFGLDERLGRVPMRIPLALALLVATGLAAGSGAVVLLPLSELGRLSDRAEVPPWEFASMLPYSWSDALNFLVPYVNGDVADGTYHAPGFFWENYGYVGITTFFLAVFAVIRGFRVPRTKLLLLIGVAAFAMVLGPNTPIYYLVWKYVPGMGHFRFPTRFLFVVDFVICVLGAQGLSLLRPILERRLAHLAPRVVPLASPIIVVGTALDLFAQQSHQNPFVPASDWLAEPAALRSLRGDVGSSPRIFSPMHDFFHRLAHRTARGWADLNPYRELRETVAPNTGVYWGISTADCYSGLGPTWFVDVWGDHSRRGLVVPALIRLGKDALHGGSRLVPVLSSYGVTHLLSPIPIHAPALEEVVNEGPAHLYQIPGRRVRVVPSARLVRSNREAAELLTGSSLDPNVQVLLHDVDPTFVPTNAGSQGTARIVTETSSHLRVEVSSPEGGYLVLADTFYPSWRATIDGTPAQVWRANVSVRALRLPPGAKSVDFYYDAAPFFQGLRVSCICLSLLLVWFGGCAYFGRARVVP